MNAGLDNKDLGDTDIVMEPEKKRKREELVEENKDTLKNDKELAMIAIGQNGYYLRYASDRLRDDKEVVMKAAEQDLDEFDFEYASDRLKDDEEVVMEAIEKMAAGFNLLLIG